MQISVASLLDDVTDPSDWQNDFVILKNLDASLRCDLCFDIYTSPVSIKSCHHTFCSTCIRTHINQSGNSGSFCPKCRQTKAYDSELIPQPVLEVTAIEWKQSRSFLARLQTDQQRQHLQSAAPPHAESSRSAAVSANKRPQSDQNGALHPASPSGGASPRRSKRIKTDIRSSVAEQSAGSRSSPLTVDDDDDGDDFSDHIDEDHDADRDADYVAATTSPHASPSKRRSNGTSSETLSSTASDRELKADDLVECPICRHRFTVTALNRHLDSARCYDGFPEPPAEERGLAPKPAKATSSWFTKNATASPYANSEATSSMANEKRLVRPQYNLKSERDLRKLLDDAGLPTSGDREKMAERHRQWINIWNANLDSTKARRTAAQLRKDLAAWERTKTSAKDHSAHVDRQKTTWIKTNRSQFDDLIQKAKTGALKDKKLRDAPAATATTESDSANRTTSAAAVEHGGSHSDVEPHVITSSPAISDAAPGNRAVAEPFRS